MNTLAVQPNDTAKTDRPTYPEKIHVEVIRYKEIDATLAQRWDDLCSTNPNLQSPYFDLRFVECVDNIRQDIEIAVVESGAQVIGFLPYQRVRKSTAVPVGGWLNDYHGLVAPPDLSLQIEEILKQCRLKSYRYHALSNGMEHLARYEYRKLACPYVDLSKGFKAYFRAARRRSSTIKRQEQKTRKLIREVGAIRIEYDCQDPSLLETLIRNKQKRFAESNTFDLFSVDWTADLLRQIFSKRSENFRGILNVLWAGDTPVASHFGMIANDILHYWFPTFDSRFKQYSPGTQMFLDVVEAACENGIRTVDLGYGDDEFKTKWASRRKHVGYGNIQTGLLASCWGRVKDSTVTIAKSLPLKTQTRSFLRKVYPRFGQQKYC